MRRFSIASIIALLTIFIFLGGQLATSVQAATYTYEWSNTISSASSSDTYFHQSVALDSSENVYITGTFYNNTDFDPGAGTDTLNGGVGGSGYLSKFASDGTYLWTNIVATDIFPLTIDVDSNNDIVITGTGSSGVVDFDPGPGDSNSTLEGTFTVKYNSDGDYIWDYTEFNDQADPITSVNVGAIDDDDNVIQAFEMFDANGDFNYSTFVRKLNSSGVLQWSIRLSPLDASSNVQAQGVTTLADGSVIVIGSYTDNIDFDPGPGTSTQDPGFSSIFVAKYQANGTFAWVRGYVDGVQGLDTADDSNNIVRTANNNIMFTGSFSGQSDFDPGPGTTNISPVGGSNYFVTQLDTNGLYVNTLTTNTANLLWHGLMPKTDNGFYIAGSLGNASVDLNPGAGTDTVAGGSSGRFVISEFEADLDYVNSYTLQGSGVTSTKATALSADQTKIVNGGHFTGTVDFNGNAGTANASSTGDGDGYLFSLDVGGAAPTNTPTPTQTPTPTNTPTPTPTGGPTSTPLPTSSNSGSNNEGARSTTEKPSCQATVPVGKPDLFQINRKGTSAVLYFTPASDNVGSYHVIYGFKEGNEQFGALSQPSSGNQGVQTLTINALDPKVNYWFKVAPVNGCAVGTWSDWLRMGQQAIIYKYLPRL